MAKNLSRRTFVKAAAGCGTLASLPAVTWAQKGQALHGEASRALARAVDYYTSEVAVHGGYVYYVSADLKQRWGEGVAGPQEFWVQPPGTPTVGLAYLKAYDATRDNRYLQAAKAAAEALMYGQLASGGWTYSVDFDPKGKRVAKYRNGKGNNKGRNYSTLDDGVTQTALRFLLRVDQALEFKEAAIHDAAKVGLDSLLAAQFANGAFPQGWQAPASVQKIVSASFPDYDWRTENRVKDYWDLYTLNDGLAGNVFDCLKEAYEITKDDRCLAAIRKLGDFLILAQLPDPQPAWAQQYTYAMRPAWARRFEPPAITGSESQDVIETLMKIRRLTGENKYLEPIPRAIAYLKKSRLPDGRLARFYELQTNKPLYMNEQYELTYDDANVPQHYGWKVGSRLEALEREYERFPEPGPSFGGGRSRPDAKRAREVLDALDSQGRWVSEVTGERLTGQPKFPPGTKYLSSQVFARNVEFLSQFVGAGAAE
jgi:PelA/Pel-15E family pectate lyase